MIDSKPVPGRLARDEGDAEPVGCFGVGCFHFAPRVLVVDKGFYGRFADVIKENLEAVTDIRARLETQAARANRRMSSMTEAA